ncbi:MAG: HlyD family efflux transporter periplasmic adaptor subunit [Chromatiaceae bacterium]|nr:HlyD family efflux transporter periplasmic adaptor subunit [Chromatiaceae bacterium]
MRSLSILFWRRLAPALIVLGLAGLLAWGLRAPALLVDVERAYLGHLEQGFSAEGRTQVMERYRLFAPLSGELRRLELEVGDWVEAGEVVARLDALGAPVLDTRILREARARIAAAGEALRAAEAGVEAAQAAQIFRGAERERLGALHARGLAARAELDSAEHEARQAAAGLREAQAHAEAARANLEAARAFLEPAGAQNPDLSGVVELRAPAAGQVLARFVESRQVVAAGEALMEIGDPGQLEVAIDVLSSDAVRLAPGMRVWFERWGGEGELEGRLRRIEPHAFTKVSALGVEEQRVWVIADFVGSPERRARLGDGYRLDARFVLWEGDKRLLVPSSALLRRADEGRGAGWSLFVLEQGRARERTVVPGRRAALESEISAGLAPGAVVIVHPPRELADGMRVRARRPPGATSN